LAAPASRIGFSIDRINPRLGGLEMKLDLFQEVAIDRDFPSDNLATGDIAILNDYVTDRSGQEGCVLEIYTVAGDFVGVVTLPADSIEPLQAGDRLSVRKLINA
jgi:hypothetical protein